MSLEQALRGLIARKDVVELVLVALGELGAHEEPVELCSEKFGKKRPEPAELWRRLNNMARSDAETRGGGRHRYRVTGFNRARQPLETYAFRHDIDEGDRELGLGDGQRGTLKELARMVRRLHDSHIVMAENTTGALNKMLSDLHAEVKSHREGTTELREQLTTTLVAQMQALQDVLDRRHERTLQTDRAERKEKRLDRLMDRLEDTGIPLLMGQATGASFITEFLASMAKNPEQLEKFFQLLTPEQIEILHQVKDVDEAAQKAGDGWPFKSKPNGKGNGAP